jgi:hypothetical protein
MKFFLLTTNRAQNGTPNDQFGIVWGILLSILGVHMRLLVDHLAQQEAAKTLYGPMDYRRYIPMVFCCGQPMIVTQFARKIVPLLNKFQRPETERDAEVLYI